MSAVTNTKDESALTFDVTLARVDSDLVRAHVNAALVGVVASALFGLVVALKLVEPEALSSAGALTWGRLRMCHTQGVFFAWFGNAFLAFLYFVIPRLADQPVTSRRLGWILFWVWNLGAVIPGWVLLLSGVSQPLEWAEFPLIIDAIAVGGLGLTCAQFLLPFLCMRAAALYVSSWYILGALAFTLFAYPMGNLIPELVPGGMGAAFSGLWTHDAVGLFVTPLALAIAYYVIPAVSHRPIFSHFLSLIGFWLLIAVYPLNGMHHYLYSSLPMPAQKGAVVASVHLGFNVILVVTNLLLSLRGSGSRIVSNLGLRFVWTGVVFYLLVSIQGATQAIMPFNRLVHFTDWVVGHAHFAMLGFGSFVAIGGDIHAWEHTPGVRLNERALGWAYWLLVSGLLVMVIDLSIAGIVQGLIWREGLPWTDMLAASRPMWILRACAGAVLVGGFAALALGLTTGPLRSKHPTRLDVDMVIPFDPAPEGGVGLKAVHFILFSAGVLSFLLSFVALGVLPGRELHALMQAGAPQGAAGYSESEARGRIIYAREGCAYCHTQQVRELEEDVRRYGAPTDAWETRLDVPHLWGTRRIGPDLARESGIHPDDWQLTHLYEPRFIERASVMPAFPWLFEGSASKPTADARDLVAYLQSLGRERARQAAPPRPPGMPMGCACMSGDPTGPKFAVSTARADVSRGAELFALRCQGCHGAEGRGDGPAAPSLWPHPAFLPGATFAGDRLSDVLWNGVPGTAMPKFRDLPAADLKSLVAFVASLGPPQDSTPEPFDAALGRAVFTDRCAPCHGERGAGNGPGEQLLPRLPASFTTKRPTAERARRVLERGIEGTAMIPMAQNMSVADEDAVIAYLRSLYLSPERQAPR